MSAVPYTPESVTRADVDKREGATVMQFGTNWCGYCQRAEPLIDAGFEQHAGIPRIKVEDGSGLPLGRSFKVKLWPTLVFLRDGREVARVVRPTGAEEIVRALGEITASA